MPPVESYPVALALTLAIEVPIYTLFLMKMYEQPGRRAATAGLLVNLATHPVVWFVLYPLLEPRAGYTGYAMIAELFAWGTEALLLSIWSGRRDGRLAVLSLLANGASYLASVLL